MKGCDSSRYKNLCVDVAKNIALSNPSSLVMEHSAGEYAVSQSAKSSEPLANHWRVTG